MLGQRATEPTQRKKTACKPTDLFYVLPFSHQPAIQTKTYVKVLLCFCRSGVLAFRESFCSRIYCLNYPRREFPRTRTRILLRDFLFPKLTTSNIRRGCSGDYGSLNTILMLPVLYIYKFQKAQIEICIPKRQIV